MKFKKGNIPWNKNQKKKMIKEMPCDYCGKTFSYYPSTYKNKNRRFCSKICYSKTQKIERKGMKFSETHRKNLSISKLKNPSRYWLGKRRSKETIGKFRKSHIGKKQSKETKLKRRISMLGKHDGEKNPAWNGGTARLPYTYQFTKIRVEILKRDNYICQECGKKGKEIHHIDYNRKNDAKNNLITLCKSCHPKTNFNRKHWENYFKMKMFIIELFNPQNILVFNENKQLIGMEKIK